MATDTDPVYPAIPQAFTFGTLALKGRLLGFAGQSQRRFVSHQFPKRSGALAEDMARGPRRIDVRLVFTATYRKEKPSELLETAAQAYQKFAAEVDKNPRALLHHPIAGQWFAFCEGPNEDVDLSRSIDSIQCRCAWVETDLDQIVPADVPAVPTAAQDVTAQGSVHEISMAEYLGEFVKAHIFNSSALKTLDDTLATIEDVGDAVDVMRNTIGTLSGVPSSIFGTLDLLITKQQLLAEDVDSFVGAATDLFSGGDVAASATSGANLLGLVLADAVALENALIDSSTSPAGAADAVGATEELVATCLVLDQAMKQSRPPIILFTVPELTNVVALALHRYPDSDPLVRASEIMGLNTIPNPAAIPAGTRLLIASR